MVQLILLFFVTLSILTPSLATQTGSNDRFIYTFEDDGTLSILNKVTMKSAVYEHKHRFFEITLNKTMFFGLYAYSENVNSFEMIDLATAQRIHQTSISKHTSTFKVTETHAYFPNYATGELKIIPFNDVRRHDKMQICYQPNQLYIHENRGYLTSDFDQFSLFIADLDKKEITKEICFKPLVPKKVTIHNDHLYVSVAHPSQPVHSYIAVYKRDDLTLLHTIKTGGCPDFLLFSKSLLYVLDLKDSTLTAYDPLTQTRVGSRKVVLPQDPVRTFTLSSGPQINGDLCCPLHPKDHEFDYFYTIKLHWCYVMLHLDVFNDYIPLILKDEPMPWEPLKDPKNHLGCAVKMKFIEDSPFELDLDDLRSSPQVMDATFKSQAGAKAAMRYFCTLLWEEKLTRTTSYLAKVTGKQTDNPLSYFVEFLLRTKHPQMMALAAIALGNRKTATDDMKAAIKVCEKYACKDILTCFNEKVPE